MKLLIVSQYFWPEDFYLNDVVARLANRGVNVDVLTGKPNYPEGKVFKGYRNWGCQTQIWEGAHVFRIPLLPRGNNSRLRLALNYLSFVLSGLIFGPWVLRGRQYDMIFVYGVSPILQAIPAIILGRFKSCKITIWIQDLWPDSLIATGHIHNPLILRAVEWAVRWIYRRADLLLVQSQAFIPAVSRLASKTRVAYQPNSVDSIFAAPVVTSAKLPDIPALDSGFAVVFAGNIGSAQAVEVIVAAAAQLVDYTEIRLVVIGQGSRLDWMRKEIKVRGLKNLHLPGRFPVATMPGLLQKAGALLVTLADEPTFALTVPNKIQAYMAVGRPIIACLNGEGARLVDMARAGISVPAEDSGGLATAILELYRMPEIQRQAMGVAAQRFFLEHFEHKMLVDNLIEHFKRSVLRSGGSK